MDDLKGQAEKAVKWTTFSTIIVAILQFSQLIVLSKFLTAEEFGLIAIVTVVIGFAQLIVDMGISNAIIHKQHTTKNQLSTLYWLNLFSGAILTVLMFISSDLIAFFYNNKDLVPLLKLLSFSFFINSVGNQFLVMLKKELNFNIIAKIEIFSISLAFLTAIIFAYLGYGAYSIIFSTLIKSVSSNIVLFILGIKHHKPNLVFEFKNVKDYLNFGLYQMGQNIIGYFNTQFDVILIGKLLGTEVLGVYSVTKQLVMRPSQMMIPVITKVAFPLMAKIQDDIPRLKKVYIKMINYIASFNFPIHLVMIFLAKDIILLLLGVNWIDAIGIFQLLAIYALIRSTMSPAGSLVLATGRIKLGLYWNIAAFVYIPLGVYIGHFYGITGVVYALLSYQLVFSLANWFFIVRDLCGASFIEYYKPQLLILIITLISLSTTVILPFEVGTSNTIQILLWLVSYSLIYIGITYFLNRSFFDELTGFLKNKIT